MFARINLQSGVKNGEQFNNFNKRNQSMPRKQITIFGAGISGLVAAISLVRLGFKVEVREKSDQIGGSPNWHPSIHQQTFNLRKTSEYIGISLAPCFHPVKKHTFYFYGRKSRICAPVDSFVCEKGMRLSSIETYLYSVAKGLGVRFLFAEPFDLKIFKQMSARNPHSIVATGLEARSYRVLDINHVNIKGFRSSREIHADAQAISYFGNYTNHEFAYVASYEGLIFALLFARKGVSKENLSAFSRHLRESENLTFDDWHFSTGCVPLEKNLLKNGFVLAGTISGMIDPFYLNGISAALISGKIAAQFFVDPKAAFQEFNRFTSNFYLKSTIKKISDKLPLKKFSFPLIAQINNRLKWVGVI